ncbi:hypothetical protein BDW42DRAFT_192088 [Aspergillus taichungensis]|uniref:Conidiation protein 6-domain-containing protein n=1 Tax=Aspergillus taichungensis TaxID=482145 RepID=A0A2J5I1T3_9EURO|nr:hypothetical protein BDW42DRAFT_192088 [Aspergillus taichungensis]
MAEERLNEMRGYKATLSNPNVSDEAKSHAQYMLDHELGGDEPRQEIHAAQSHGEDPTRVAAGYKAAQKNPNVTKQGKQRAGEKLREMDVPEE